MQVRTPLESKRFGSRSKKKAAALLITVLLTIATATIAMLAVRVILSASNEDVSRTELYLATSKSETIHAKLRAELILDPQIVYKKVFENEPDRICYGENNTLYSQNQEWPQSCGSFWGYAEPDSQAESVLMITPPTPSQQSMIINIVSKVGSTAAGLRAEYGVSSLSSPNVYSGGELNLTEMGANSVLKGVIYSNNSITYSDNLNTEKAIIATEKNITNPSSIPSNIAQKIDSRRALTNSPSGNEQSVRLLYSEPIPQDSLRTAITALQQRNCSVVNPVNITVDGVKRSTSLCIKAGSTIVKSDNMTTIVPNSKAYLILPNATTSDHPTIDIYTRSSKFAHPDCSNCDLIAESNTSLNSLAHPGILTSWSKIATAYLPASGYVITDKETHIGLCGQNFTTDQSCDSINNSSPGSLVKDPFILVVGSIDTPRDLYISGPINLQDRNKPIGALVTGKVYIPYWASPRNKDLTISIDLGVVGSVNKSSIMSFPRQASSQENNTSGNVIVKGKILAEKIDIQISSNLFQSYQWDQSIIAEGSTLLPAPSLTWSKPKVRRMSATEISQNL